MSDELTNDNIEEVITDAPQPEAEEVVSEQPEVEEAQEGNNEEATPTEPENDEAQEKSTEEAPETAVAEEQPPSRREQLRIQQLLKKYGPPEQRQQAPLQTRQDALDYGSALDADPDVIQQLEADRRQTAEYEYNRGLADLQRTQAYNQYQQFYNNIRFDLPLVTEKLSKLDPVDAQAIDDEYMAITGANPNESYVRNPNIGYAEFVEARLEQARRLASSMNAQTVKNVAKQAATTGLRPDGSSANRMNLNKDPQDMTTEELYAVLGQKPPKK